MVAGTVAVEEERRAELQKLGLHVSDDDHRLVRAVLTWVQRRSVTLRMTLDSARDDQNRRRIKSPSRSGGALDTVGPAEAIPPPSQLGRSSEDRHQPAGTAELFTEGIGIPAGDVLALPRGLFGWVRITIVPKENRTDPERGVPIFCLSRAASLCTVPGDPHRACFIRRTLFSEPGAKTTTAMPTSTNQSHHSTDS
jgi:hypothetical protein